MSDSISNISYVAILYLWISFGYWLVVDPILQDRHDKTLVVQYYEPLPTTSKCWVSKFGDDEWQKLGFFFWPRPVVNKYTLSLWKKKCPVFDLSVACITKKASTYIAIAYHYSFARVTDADEDTTSNCILRPTKQTAQSSIQPPIHHAWLNDDT